MNLKEVHIIKEVPRQKYRDDKFPLDEQRKDLKANRPVILNKRKVLLRIIIHIIYMNRTTVI